MQIVYTVLILLLVVALSGVVLRMLPVKLPLPLVQIALGALLALPAFGIRVNFDPELFFVLFIPPLLFADGWRMPRREFLQLRGPILTLALGLVFFTVLAMGYFVHWMIPAVPLAVAFALASVLSPTDALAVSSISGGHAMPSRLLHILEGEALMNDASGLVSLQFAVAAALTGVFSLAHAAGRFAWVALGGLAIGFLVTVAFALARRRLVRWSGEMDPPSHIALLLLLPFAAYLLAEHVGVSGILAAVAAGMAMNSRVILRGNTLAVATRMQSNGVWSMLEFVFNGIIFLLLGQQLPSIIGHARIDLQQAGGGALWHLPAYVLAITVGLMLLRLLWIWLTLLLMRIVSRLRKQVRPRVSARLIGVTVLSGVRGAITLAGVLSLPLTLGDGAAFPARDLLIFLSAGVILCTLLIGSIGLPLTLRHLKMPAEDSQVTERRDARQKICESAMQAIQQRLHELEDSGAQNGNAALAVGSRLLGEYQQRLAVAAEGDDEGRQQARESSRLERELRSRAIQAGRDQLQQLRRSYRINDQTLRLLQRELDLEETVLTAAAEL